MLRLKCDHPFLCEFSILFSIVKLLKSFSQFIKDMENWDFWKASAALPNFSNSLKSLKIGTFELPCLHTSVK